MDGSNAAEREEVDDNVLLPLQDAHTRLLEHSMVKV